MKENGPSTAWNALSLPTVSWNIDFPLRGHYVMEGRLRNPHWQSQGTIIWNLKLKEYNNWIEAIFMNNIF